MVFEMPTSVPKKKRYIFGYRNQIPAFSGSKTPCLLVECSEKFLTRCAKWKETSSVSTEKADLPADHQDETLTGSSQKANSLQ